MRYHAHPNGYLTLDNDPTPVLRVAPVNDGAWHAPETPALRNTRITLLAELASDGNHAREWAQRAAEIWHGEMDHWLDEPTLDLLREMAAYAREQVTS